MPSDFPKQKLQGFAGGVALGNGGWRVRIWHGTYRTEIAMFPEVASARAFWPQHLSSKRARLTSYEYASRVAKRIFDQIQKPVVVLYEGSPCRQYRVVTGPELKEAMSTGNLSSQSIAATFL